MNRQHRRSTLSQSNTRFIGLDVHKDAIAVAYVAPEHGAAVMYLGAIGTRQGDLDQLIRKMPSKAQHLLFLSEAGPCGDGLSRSLMPKGDACGVVAPARRPPKPGERVKTDRREAMPLARLARAGDLTAVSGPTVEDDARRERPRAREDAISECTDAKLRLTAFLLRHDLRSVGRAHGGPAPRRWRSEVVCPTPAPPMVFQAYVRAVREHHERRQRLDQALHEQVSAWRLSPGVEALQALRGVPLTGAVTLVAAMGDLSRFASPRELLQFLGLMPSEHASGAHHRQGARTKAGNTPARRRLVEGAGA